MLFIFASGLPTFSASPVSQKANSRPLGEAIDDDNGNLFMEEVVDSKPKPKLPRVPIDLSRVGVSVDPHGNIVPIKDAPDDPWAGSGVKPFVNEIDSSFQALPNIVPYGYGGYPGYGYPGYGRSIVPGYNAPGYLNPSLNYRPVYPNGYVGNGFYPNYGSGYGNQYYGYGGGYNPINGGGFSGGNLFGSPGYGYGNGYGFGNGNGYGNNLNPYGYNQGYGRPLASFKIGNFQASIGSAGPAYYPPAPFYPRAFNTPTYYPAGGTGFLAPYTTYSQTSMWKAFNLAF